MQRLILLALAVAAQPLPVLAQQAPAPASGNCQAMASELEAMSAQLGAQSADLQAQLDASLADQAAYKAKLERQRNAAGTRAAIGGLLDGIVPGAGLLGMAAGAIGGGAGQPEPPESGDLSKAANSLLVQSALATRLGDLHARFEAAGCRSVLGAQQ